MKIDFLRDAASTVAGKNTGPIVDLLFDKKNVNEFIIAKKLGLTINQTRNILYKLSDEGLVSFVRKKDKKKGWYTYFWTFNTEKALLFLQKNILNNINQFEHQLKSREAKRFYTCLSCNTEVSEEAALNNNFSCPECGEVYVLNDNKKAITDISNSMNKLKKELTEINAELVLIAGKKTKKMEKEIKKEAKEKVERRRKSQIQRKRTAAKNKLLKVTKVKVHKRNKKKPLNKKRSSKKNKKRAKKR